MPDYSYLLNQPMKLLEGGGVGVWENNIFEPLTLEEVEKAESILGQTFPNELREFYLQVGYGNLTTPHNPPPDYKFYNSNEILPPSVVAHLGRGELEWENQHYWMSPSTFELLQPGDLPFFEVADSSGFMIMKLHSDNPNAVWNTWGNIKIEDSFERFIWRLYYEDPGYYGDIVMAHYASKKS